MTAVNPDLEGAIPHEVITFWGRMDELLQYGDVRQVNDHYETGLDSLSKELFTSKQGQPALRSWPALKQMRPYLKSAMTQRLYEAVFYRQLYTEKGVTADVRKASWEVYTSLFQDIYSSGLSLDLPNGWLWDIVDEFVYELQMNNTRRAPGVPESCWNVQAAMTKLEGIVKASDICDRIRDVKEERMPVFSVFDDEKSRCLHVRRVLGLFSLVALLRVNVLLGDYYAAMDIADRLQLHTVAAKIMKRVPAAHVSLFYHVGFAYLMLRRYADAADMFNEALAVRPEQRQYADALQQQSLSLLAMTSTLGGMPFDVNSFVDRSKKVQQEEDVLLMEQGDIDRLREVFMRTCPKFIPMGEVATGGAALTGLEGKEQQCRVFMREVQQRVGVLRLRGYLRLYQTVTTDKVALLLGCAPEEVDSQILCCKLKMRQLTHPEDEKEGTHPLRGEWMSHTNIDFTVSGNTVNVVRHNTEAVSPLITLYQRIQGLKPRGHGV